MKYIIFISILLISCEKEYITDPFIGTWKLDSVAEVYLTFDLFGQGSEEMIGMYSYKFTWEALDVLTLTWEDGTERELEYCFKSDSLELTDKGIIYKYTKQ